MGCQVVEPECVLGCGLLPRERAEEGGAQVGHHAEHGGRTRVGRIANASHPRGEGLLHGWSVGVGSVAKGDGQLVPELTGGEALTTNNRMELMAAIVALETLSEACTIVLHTDSQYVRQGITEWMPNWVRRNWKTAGGAPVKNRDLWERLHAARGRHRIDWRWVKGHSGDPDNDRVDELARDQALNFKRMPP